MYIKRKSDGLILCSEENIKPGPRWVPHINKVEKPTITGVYHPLSGGVRQHTWSLTCYFADHYVDSTLANFDRLEEACNNSRILLFEDFARTVWETRVFNNLGEDDVRRWEEVPGRMILIVRVVLLKLAYVQ